MPSPLTEPAPVLAYDLVDVFTDQAFAGNPLAVVHGADELTTGQLQALAREFNLSETAFPMAPAEASASYRLRIFTPSQELPFAGHPSVGAAWVLHARGRLPVGDAVQECGAGLLPVSVTPSRVTLTGGRPVVGEPLDAEPFLAACGLPAGDAVGTPVRWCGVGISFAYLHVEPAALSRCSPDLAALTQLGNAGVSVLAWDGTAMRCRVFAAGAGVPEDAATGSAALGSAVWLVASGLLGDGPSSYDVVQGVEMGRPSLLSVTVEATGGAVRRTAVSGSVVPVGHGEIHVPG